MAAPTVEKEHHTQNVRIDPNKLDEWLENDLRASGILQPHEEGATSNRDQQNSDTITAKAEPEEAIEHSASSSHHYNHHHTTTTALPLTTIFKAFATLTALQQQQQQQQPLSSSVAASASTLSAMNTTPHGTKRPSSSSCSTTSSHSHDGTDLKDHVALKRQRNTDAARRSRLRKVQKMEALEHRVKQLQTLNGQLQLKIAVLESERDAARRKQGKYEERVSELETQLAEAHEALVRR